MAITTRHLRCGSCGQEFEGSWSDDSSVQPESARCPACGKRNQVRPKYLPGAPSADGRILGEETLAVRAGEKMVSSANHFNVRRMGEIVCFSIWQNQEGKTYELRGEFDRELALNLAAWIVAIADPEETNFLRVLQEITKT